jgi:hypothetical protein
MIHGTGRGGNIVFINNVATNEHKQKIILFLTKYLRRGYSIYEENFFCFELNNLFLVDKKGK